VGGDGCSPACLVEVGWDCASNNCTTVCGDGIRAGLEACDDGNVASGDGCAEDCANVEQDWNCSITDHSGKSICKKCGNNILEADEVGYPRTTLISAIVLALLSHDTCESSHVRTFRHRSVMREHRTPSSARLAYRSSQAMSALASTALLGHQRLTVHLARRKVLRLRRGRLFGHGQRQTAMGLH
jgi:cysteine-rich repeat protein